MAGLRLRSSTLLGQGLLHLVSRGLLVLPRCHLQHRPCQLQGGITARQNASRHCAGPPVRVSTRTRSHSSSRLGNRQPHCLPYLRQPQLPATDAPPIGHAGGEPGRMASSPQGPGEPSGRPPWPSRTLPRDRRRHPRRPGEREVRSRDRGNRPSCNCSRPSAQPLVKINHRKTYTYIRPDCIRNRAETIATSFLG
jgi:hypothetical protein